MLLENPMLPEHLLALAIFMFSATITPGPNNIMVMTSSLNHGVLKTLPHYLGICLGFPAMLIEPKPALSNCNFRGGIPSYISNLL
jgi:hypothetical protein